MGRLIVLFGLVLALLMLAAGLGETWINPLAPASQIDATILHELRWPRVWTAFAVGGLLALAGSWFQTLLGNPLAEPYVLGVAGSASLGAVLGLVAWPESMAAMSLGAWLGAWFGIALVMAFARLGRLRLLLAGIVLAAFWSAALALVLAVLPGRELGIAFAWMMGDLGRGDVPIGILLATWGAALAAGMLLSRSLDCLMLGEKHAAALGISVKRVQRGLILLASTATALSVAAAGTIGFVGLVVPHLMRLLVGSRHRRMLPAAAVGGGGLLVLADAAARTLTAPAEMPVGVFTAMIGVPIFLWLLVRRSPHASA